MQQIKLGRNGPMVSAFGLGCMGMSGIYGPAEDAESIATIHAALDAGITVIDTGDFYGMGHNEMLIRDALKGGKRDRAFIMVKCGSLRSPDGKIVGDDARPQSIKNFLSYSLRRLGTDHIDLYQSSRVDPQVPIEDLLDCADASGQALAALRIGLRHLILTPDAPGRARVAKIVADLNGTLLPERPPALDLADPASRRRLHESVRTRSDSDDSSSGPQ